MALFCVPVLMYVQYTALRYSKITIFASACRFWIQALRKTCATLITASALIFQPAAGFADESARNVRE
ncbi:predicted protein, partial [Brucella abortus bv. 2 str. 86/8/59]